jgi:protease-4
MYFKKTLDKLGVSVEVTHAGKYKDFGDMFTRSDMSAETREVMTSVVGGLYGNLVDRIAAGRKKSPDEVKALLDQGPYTANGALKAGLVDGLKFEDELWAAVRDKLGATPVKISAAKYAKVAPETAGMKMGSHVAILAAEGDIVMGSPSDDGTETGTITAYGLIKQLRNIGGDSNIRAVVVRIDSPGGEVTASDDLWREMGLLSKKKPVVISMSDVAASGGYYMALTGDPMVAYPETETGSIGVVFAKPNLHGLYDKLGISKDSVQLGAHADIDSDYTTMTPDERKILVDGIDESYRDFVTKVADARHTKYEAVDAVAQGRVWLGSEAKDHNLVDALGGLDTAIAMVKKKAGIPDSENVTIFSYPPQENFLNILTKHSQENAFDAKIRAVVGRMPFHAWMHGGYLRIMPVWFDVK